MKFLILVLIAILVVPSFAEEIPPVEFQDESIEVGFNEKNFTIEFDGESFFLPFEGIGPDGELYNPVIVPAIELEPLPN